MVTLNCIFFFSEDDVSYIGFWWKFEVESKIIAKKMAASFCEQHTFSILTLRRSCIPSLGSSPKRALYGRGYTELLLYSWGGISSHFCSKLLGVSGCLSEFTL